MSQYQSIILCANPRSGSTMLCDLMALTGALGRPASFYRPESIPEWAKQLGVNHEPGSEEFESAYLAAIRNEGTDTTGTFGLRLMWDTVEGLVDRLSVIFGDELGDAALFERAFGQPLYINLVREDKVAQAVSLVRAKQSGQWHLASDGAVMQGSRDPAPITYDARAIEKEIVSLRHDDAEWKAWFAQEAVTPLPVAYEALVTDPKAVIGGLLNAAGHDPAIAHDIIPRTARMADDESRQWIERYKQEVR